MNLWSQAVSPELPTPSVLVNEQVARSNIQRMAEFAWQHGKRIRPHLKTHKSVALARIQLELGAQGLTCAKLDEAECFLSHGFTSILIAYPILGHTRIMRAQRLVREYSDATIEFVVDSTEGIESLERIAQGAGRTLQAWIEIDSGLKRCGVQPGEGAVSLATRLSASSLLQFKGLLTHAGHGYSATDPALRRSIGLYEAQCLLETQKLLTQRGIPCPELSVGSTPTVEFSGAVPGISEIRPGNYIFYDMTQVALGVVPQEHCALRVLTQVVSVAQPGYAVIDAGAKTLALDKGTHGLTLLTGHGAVVGSPESVIERLSEEHGVIRLAPGLSLRPGDRLEIIPNHACPVMNLARSFWLINCASSQSRELPVDAHAGVH
jgi:D-serine deaminase-like pyridoxal phosphate-dependent protein